MALKKGQEVELEIIDAAFKGKGLAKVDGLAVFVPNTTPGDKVKARIIKKKKKYREAKLLEILEPSPHRIEPKCRHANVCGGCSWQHIPYAKQLEYKSQQVRDHIERIGGLEGSIVKKGSARSRNFIIAIRWSTALVPGVGSLKKRFAVMNLLMTPLLQLASMPPAVLIRS